VTASSYFADNPRETFPPANLVDGRFNDEGTEGSWGFWVGTNGDLAEVTIDLEQAFPIAEIVLQNTHNRQNNDRGTQDYRLSVSVDGDRYTTIDEGTLANAFKQKEIDQHRVRLSKPMSARYLKFQALSFFGVGAGLNEIQVYAAPPTVD